MAFIPEQEESKTVPLFEDVSGRDGWEGHESEKSIDRLKAEVAEAVGRLGGFVSGYRSGVFHTGEQERAGLQLHYSINGVPARLDIAALPVRRSSNRDKSLRMALYMIRNAFRGLWYLQQVSPGYSPLMPFMIADNEGHTLTELWAGRDLNKLMPPSGGDFIEAEEIK